MPELPEVETVRRGVAAAVAGLRVEEVEATGARSTRRHSDGAAYCRRVRGSTLVGVDRVGKYLIGGLDSGDVTVVHLGMSGQLRVADSAADRPAHTHVVWRFEGGRELRFVDPRTFGQVWVSRPDGTGTVPELAHLGVDALDGLPTWRSLVPLLAGRRGRLKPLLLDQRVLAGIGNLYADEVLFHARLHGDRVAGELAAGEVRRLHLAVSTVLPAAIAAGGSSLADAQYRNVDGALGRYQDRHAVYGRAGRPCPRCDTPVRRDRWSGRSSFTCPRCQPAPTR